LDHSAKGIVGCALGISRLWVPQWEQDRSEKSTGINLFTLAICIAALVAGADLLPSPASEWDVELADVWNSNIERGRSVSRTPLAKQLGVFGYYVLVCRCRYSNGRKSFNKGPAP
jgi:glucoamylase